MKETIEGILAIIGILGTFKFGIIIGRDFTTFEKFVLTYLNLLKKHLKGPPSE